VIRQSWAGLLSSPFNAVNGIKQGGILSPVLFCIYIDGLLTKLSESGVGFYMGAYFCGALAYTGTILSSLLYRLLLCVNYSQYATGMPVIMILFSMLINQSLLFLLVLTGVFWSRQ